MTVGGMCFLKTQTTAGSVGSGSGDGIATETTDHIKGAG